MSSKRKEAPSRNDENAPNNKKSNTAECKNNDFLDSLLPKAEAQELIRQCLQNDRPSLERLKQILERNAATQPQAKEILSHLVGQWLDAKTRRSYLISTFRTQVKNSLNMYCGYHLDKSHWVPHPSQTQAYNEHVSKKQAAEEASDALKVEFAASLAPDEILDITFSARPKEADKYFRDVFDKKSNDDQLDGFFLKSSASLLNTPFAFKLSQLHILQAINGQSIQQMQFQQVRDMLQGSNEQEFTFTFLCRDWCKKMNYEQLQRKCADRNLPKEGRKADLLERLRNFDRVYRS